MKTLPSSIDAERSVLGALLAAGSLDLEAGHRTLERVIATGLDPLDFEYASNGHLFAFLLELHHHGHPLDLVSVAYALEESGVDVTTRARLEVLAREITVVSPAPHWAAIVARAGRVRRAA